MRFKIGTKIGIVFLIFFIEILVFTFTLSIISSQHWYHMHELHGEIEKLDLVKHLQIALAQIVMPVNDFLIVGGDPNEPENFKVLSIKLEELIDEMDKLEFKKLEERKLLNHIKEEYPQIKEIALKIFSMPNAIGNREAGRLMEKMDRISDDALIDAEKFHQFAHQKIEEAQRDWQRTKKHLDLLGLVGILLNIALILGGLVFFRRIISSPINSIRDVALKIGRGNLEERVNIRPNDEIGDLASSFNKMIEDLKSTQTMLIQAEKMVTLGQLAAGVAHEVNNPLSAILIEAEMLLKDKDKDKDTKDASKTIVEQAERIKLINQRLLEFSRKKEFKFEPLDINSTVEESLSLLKYQVKIENIEVVKELSPNLPKVRGDLNQLQEVFLNITSNATQAMQKGGRLTIRTHLEKIIEYGKMVKDIFKPGEEIVVIEFKDTGKGMNEETLKRVFDPFFSTKEKGIGLGLAICYRIIEAHNGTIEAQSKLEEGSTFIVKLPIIQGGN